jgi:hypothetical protein
VFAGALPAPAQTPAQRALARLNVHRQKAGLKAVTLDATLSRGCQLHAKYLHLNRRRPETRDLRSHDENPRWPGYTPEGRKAAKASTIHYVSDPVRAVDEWMASLYHRLPLMREGLTSIGYGSHGSIAVLDCITGWNRPEITPVAYPGEGQSGLPLRYVPENPDPLPRGASQRAGYPVTLQFRPYGQKVTEVKAELRAGNKPVKCYTSHPQRPASSYDQQNAICLIAVKPLSPHTKYFVTVRARVDGAPFERKWSFTTGG